ncbi:VOC family protein [Mucilaginibacter hurinus]|uniref:VOC family protein n=1 Tax=Mucilaginibacter hurinus TaxID=2201324 RepID=A0A367GN21_9SPHI|nr:VOC family protein [Mucilaginibacter hurinus]RCH54892.1 VOC family protein [Mucilaginibacter hurinus]
MLINPYLYFKGNTEEAFNFYSSVFGTEIVMIMRFKDTPEAGNVSAADQDKIMHIALPIGKNNVLMGNDMVGADADKLTIGTNFHISFSAESKEQADNIFAWLSSGGTITVPLETSFWGAYFGMCTDKYNIQWMVSYDERYQ